MESADLKPMTVTIAGRVFPVKVTEEEMVYFSDIIAQINEKIVGFQTQYPTRDKLDHVIMALLTFVNDSVKAKQNAEVISKESMQSLTELSHMLDDMTSKEIEISQ